VVTGSKRFCILPNKRGQERRGTTRIFTKLKERGEVFDAGRSLIPWEAEKSPSSSSRGKRENVGFPQSAEKKANHQISRGGRGGSFFSSSVGRRGRGGSLLRDQLEKKKAETGKKGEKRPLPLLLPSEEGERRVDWEVEGERGRKDGLWVHSFCGGGGPRSITNTRKEEKKRNPRTLCHMPCCTRKEEERGDGPAAKRMSAEEKKKR